MRRPYKIVISTQGKDYETTVMANRTHTAAARALFKWRGWSRNGYDRKGPGYGIKPKEIIIKITRE